MKRVTFIFIIILAGFALNGCTSRYEKVETQEFTPSADGKTSIKIENTSGEIKVVKNDEEKIRIIATKKTNVRKKDLDKPIDDIKIEVIENGSEIRIETEMSDSRHGFSFSFNENKKVDYLIYVPARFDVDIDNVNGNIEVTDINGDVSINLVNGNIGLSNVTGIISTELINGNTTSEISTTKGINMSTINGKINLKLPNDISAKIYADVTNGKVVTNDIAFTNSHDEKNHFSGRLGSGDFDIKLESVNGRITIDALNDQTISTAGEKSKEEIYLLMKENYENAKSDLIKAEEEYKKAEEEYLKERSTNKDTPIDSVKSDSIKTL